MWTAHRNLNQIIFNSDWNNKYKPSSKIKSEWYDSVLAEINTEEVYETLSNLSNNKACGPSGISYEMIKHSGLHTIQAITALLNRCLTTQAIPKQWKDARIFPIPKKPTFDGDLNNTRPISLIEHIK